MPVGICNKCGEPKELVLQGCVCDHCSDALDGQWGHSIATDWVLLVMPIGNDFNWEYPPSAVGWLCIGEYLAEGRRDDPKNAHTKTASPVARGWPPLGLLTCVSPEAELFRPIKDLAITKYIFRDVGFDQMKVPWAKASQDGGVEIGGPEPSDLAALLSIPAPWTERARATILSPDGDDVFVSAPTLIRPATDDEIALQAALLRDQQRRERIEQITDKWGFDIHKIPVVNGVTDPSRQQQCIFAWEEIRETFRAEGLLDGSLFDQETELKLVFAADRSPRSPQENLDMLQSIRIPKPRPVGSIGNVSAAGQSASELVQQQCTSVRGLSQVAGMTHLKELLIHEVLGPFRDPELYRRYRVSLPNGILFYGAPGCGKTYLARCLAEELGWSFQYCRPSDVASPYVHDTVSRIRALFSTAVEKAPSVVFIDEFEAFVPARSALGGHQQYKAEEVNEFLANLEGCAERKVLVIAATNEPDKIDPAVRRSGRFDKLILIPPPDAEARRAMLDFHLSERPFEEGVDTGGIATVLEGYSASDIKLLVDEAARIALKRRQLISTGTLLEALERVPASITSDDILRYSEFRSRGI